jgi:DNA-binding Xre family transcriptional regulator
MLYEPRRGRKLKPTGATMTEATTTTENTPTEATENGKPERDMTFRDNLEAAMTAKKIGVDKLSQATGINRRLISRYRSRGKNHSVPRDAFGDPSANAKKIAKALDVKVDSLFAARK